MKSAVAGFLVLLSFPLIAEAAFTDFEDLPGRTLYPVGSSIVSTGLKFDVIPFPNTTGVISASIADEFGPLQTIQLSTGSAGLDFELPLKTNFINFDYFASPNGSGFIINGIASPLSSVGILPGDTIIGGVSIHFEPYNARPFRRRLIVSGDIDTFVVGGIEFSIDNVAVFVPEPSVTAFLLIAAPMATLKRRLR